MLCCRRLRSPFIRMASNKLSRTPVALSKPPAKGNAATQSNRSLMQGDESEEYVAKYNSFWKQFLSVADDLHQIRSGEDHAFQVLANEIVNVHSRLHFEIEKDSDLLLCDSSITITANGDQAIFPYVIGLSQACPTRKLTEKRWKLIAFKQRNPVTPEHPDRKVLELGSLSLTYSAVQFVAYFPEPEQTEKKIQLVVCVNKGLTNVSGHVEDMLMLMMVAAIGEYDFSTAIGSIQYVQEFPDAQASIYDLSRLGEVVDEFVASNLE